MTIVPAWMSDGCNLLVVAPHPDDDVIGCGGTLFGLTRAGIQPTVMYVTDGSASHPNSVRFPPSKLAALREREARAALDELGIRTEPIFLRVRDGAVSALEPLQRQRIIAQIAQTVSNLAIDTILGPWPHDPHPDHVATARAIRKAIRPVAPPVRAVCYTVWAAIRGSAKRRRRLTEQRALEMQLDGEQVAAKRRALMRHESQTSGLIDDDPQGFRIDDTLLDEWLQPVEYFRMQESC